LRNGTYQNLLKFGLHSCHLNKSSCQDRMEEYWLHHQALMMDQMHHPRDTVE